MDPGGRSGTARRARGNRSFGAWRKLLVGMALVGLAGTAFPSLALALALERGPYLQLGTPTSVVVRWRTDAPSSSQLRYGPAPDQLDDVLEIGGSRTEHEIEITGLAPGSVYFYAVGSATQTLAGGDADHYFRTSPPPGSAAPFRIWVIGDSGKANQAAQDVRDAYLGFAATHPAELWLMLGDNAYDSGTDAEYTAAVFQIYPQVLRNTVLWPSPGNHEFPDSNSATQTGPYYEAFTLPTAGEAGGVPSGTEAYYSFDYGNVHFVALDSDDTSRDVGDPMYSWLELDLQANDKDFTIVYWHHPPYSKGYHDSDTSGTQTDMRENFVPLLEDYGVDLQLTGHSHSFERSMLIDGHYGVSSTFDASNVVDGGDGDPDGDGGYHKPSVGPAAHEGAVYSVVGSSSDTDDGPLNHPIMVRSISSIEGSMVIEVEGRTLRAWWVDRMGVIHDHFELSKGPPLPSPIPSLPKRGLVGLVVLLLLTGMTQLNGRRRTMRKPARATFR